MSTGYKIENNDLENLLEVTRDNPSYSDSVIDITSSKPSPFEDKGYNQSDSSSVPLTKFFSPFNSSYDPGVDISSSYSNVTNLLAKKGHRPRFSELVRSWNFGINGGATIKNIVIKRRSSYLEIFSSSTSITSGFNRIENGIIDASNFPNNNIPHILFFRLCAGGGGGSGGVYIFPYLGFSGRSGGGGGIAFGWIPLTETSGANPTADDFIFSIYKGGNGGGKAQDGNDGEKSFLYKGSSSTVVATCNGGEGADQPVSIWPEASGGKAGASSGYEAYILKTQTGGWGKSRGNGEDILIDSVESEVLNWESFGGVDFGGGFWQGAGGGASIGNGGNGSNAAGEDGHPGDKGGGGGGGAGGTRGSGGRGGHGFLELFY
jgi:hypothetical protein